MPALDGSSSGVAQDIWRGTKVGKYELLTLLSCGGMAELFLGYTQGPGGFRKYVVIKRILPDARDNEQFVKMFLDEARITAAFSHPNIAQVYDLGDDEDGLYIAMEFIGGQNLNQVTNGCAKARAVMPLGFSASVVHDCALALHYAHTFKDPAGKEYPVIHRDVAQKNIMVTYDGQVKLLDFGVAKARGTLGRTQVGAVKGTTGYMSPEQVRGEPLDGRSDVFSLGVVLYEMITGQRLFSAHLETEEMRMILEAPVPRPSEVLAIIPEELSDIAMRALARDRADRFANARELARALQSACSHLLFDQEQRAVFMRELFEGKMLATQQLLESAGANLDRGSLIDQAARAIVDDLGQTADTQEVAKRLPAPKLAAAKKKRVKKEANRQADERLEEVKAKATAMAVGEELAGPAPRPQAPGPETSAVLAALEKPKAEGGIVLPLLLLVTLGAGGFGIYQIVFAHEEPPPVAPYQADVPIPQFGEQAQGAQAGQGGQGGQGPAAANPAPEPQPEKAAAATDKDKDKDKDKGRVKDDGAKKPKGQGQLTLFTIPPGAKVMLGKTEVGRTPLVNQALPAGTHRLMLIFPDGDKKELSAPIEPNKTLKFKLTRDELPDWGKG